MTLGELKNKLGDDIFDVKQVIKVEKHVIEICMGSSCFARGNDRNLSVIEDFIARKGLKDEVLLRGSRCEGKCPEGPNIMIDGRSFSKVRPEDLERILEKTLPDGKEV